MSGANTPLVNLIFGDDFNGSFIDPHWTVLTRDGDQSNSEQQYYLPGQVTLDGSSHVLLTAANGPHTGPGYLIGGGDASPPDYQGTNVTRSYISGMMQWNSFSYTYGKLQASAQFCNGNLLWPAIWMQGIPCQASNIWDPDNVGTCNWPTTYEIDIAEFINSSTAFDVDFWDSGGSEMAGAGGSSATASTAFHTYELDWSSGSLNFLLDGSSIATYSGGPSSAMFLIMNNAIKSGGTPGFTPQPSLIVDWIRVFHN